MLIDEILNIHAEIQDMKLGVNAVREQEANELVALTATPTLEMRGLLR